MRNLLFASLAPAPQLARATTLTPPAPVASPAPSTSVRLVISLAPRASVAPFAPFAREPRG
ncbi:hypothetical protein [Streptomyces sp. NPDC005784]|uniref:hypothetical protein n=1 Tax=Streptomyces sp. NPDC005784 TaxID=3364731 RepID=UPI00369A8899